MTDQNLTCRDCAQSFVFTASEREVYASKGYTNEPSRCPSCRANRKERQANAPGNHYGNDRGYRSGGSSMSRERQMFPAVCGNCGKQTEVPFQPRNDRPVYCSTCYEAQRGTAVGSRRGGRSN